MAAPTVDKLASKTRFKTNEATSSNPNREWSVYTVFNPSAAAYAKLSCASTLVAWWACTMPITSLAKIHRSKGKEAIKVGRQS
eukprot:scaffold395495_cov47-Attheya_sp.AAC.1